MDDLLDLSLEKKQPKQVRVKDLDLKKVNMSDKTRHKVVFYTEDSNDNMFRMSSAWINFQGRKLVKTLWLNPNAKKVYRQSNIGKVLKFYDKDSIRDFVGSYIYSYPDANNYLVVMGCDMKSGDDNITLKKEDLY